MYFGEIGIPSISRGFLILNEVATAEVHLNLAFKIQKVYFELLILQILIFKD